MKLVNTKLSKSKSKKSGVEPIAYEGEKYPYGLQLRFDTTMTNKLPKLKDLTVGDTVIIEAVAVVIGVSINEQKNGKKDHFVEMQIHEIGCAPKINKPVNKMNPKEYKTYRESMS